MNTQRQVMQQALDALNAAAFACHRDRSTGIGYQCHMAAKRLEEALAQPVQPETGHWIASKDVDEMAKRLDIAMNGGKGVAAAPQLCDVVSQAIETLRSALAPVVTEPVVTEPVYQVRQNVGRSIWADVSRAEFDSADRSPDNQRVLFTATEQAVAKPVQPSVLCMCKDRAASECPGEWEPGCDLGANEKYVRAGAQPVQQQSSVSRT